ncbi:MAG: pseudouridine synthase [Hespellia sp.]|nr:pseudouridine synthase [Hespellia sp.]
MMRLDKYLTEMGTGSRSEVKKYIQKGLVTVDGTLCRKPEQKINEELQTVNCQGVEIKFCQFEYFMLNKPAGIISAASDSREETVLDLIVDKKRTDLFPVGRLDRDTEGLLLITNDGALSHRLLSPKKHVDKVYYARIAGRVTEKEVLLFHEGLDIGEKQLTKPGELHILSSGKESEIELTIHEGKFHQVKRMFLAVGMEVLYLKRLRMGSLRLDETLAPGEYRPLTSEELETLGH